MKHILRVLTLAVAVTLVFMNGCSRTEPQVTSRSGIEKEQAVSLAIKEAMRLGWGATEVGSAILEEGIWKVFLWCLPVMPGGHGIIYVSGDGKVIRVIRGK